MDGGPGGGEGYKFLVKPSADLKCIECSQVAVEPWQHGKCGRLFCKLCLDQHGITNPCPECKTSEPMPRYFEDNRSKKNIDALHVKCAHGPCNWIGRFCSLQEHFAVCPYAFVPCPYDCKDDSDTVRYFSKSSIDDHMKGECPNREYSCKYCEEKGTYVSITEVHDKICKKKPIPCPHSECGSMVQRRGVKRHLETCLYEDVPCKYAKLGCGTAMRRHVISNHESDEQLHMQMAMNTVVWLEKEVNMLKQRGNLVLKNGESMTFKMTKYKQRKDSNEVFSAPQFLTTDGHSVVIQVHPNGSGSSGSAGQHLSVIIQVGTSGNRSDIYAEVQPFNGNITVHLLNQLTDDNHHSKTGRNIAKFIASSKLDLNSSRRTQYLKDDTLYFKVSVDTPSPKPWLECTV